MIPHFQLPALHLFGMTLHPFTYLTMAGLALCYVLAQRRARAVGFYTPLSAVALFWIAVGGFLGSHLLEALAYQPARLIKDPLWLFAIWDGMSSFGGFLGGTIALAIYCDRRRVWMLACLDALVYGFAPGWIVARAGCFVSHDHLGTRSDFLLAVAYPGGSRHNLGLYEMLLAAAITVVLQAVARRRSFVGFHTALVLCLYAPARFLLDLLRTDDARYLGLTPAQYLCIPMLALAVYLIVRGRRAGAPERG
jgi:phosphatidylglycerol:prolipoprotein diacylglycerol transferase